jgi:hypothetical protein
MGYKKGICYTVAAKGIGYGEQRLIACPGDDYELQWVKKPKTPKFDPEKCRSKLIKFSWIRLAAMDADGFWHGSGMTKEIDCDEWDTDTVPLYEDEPSNLWRETLTIITDEMRWSDETE